MALKGPYFHTSDHIARDDNFFALGHSRDYAREVREIIEDLPAPEAEYGRDTLTCGNYAELEPEEVASMAMDGFPLVGPPQLAIVQ